MKIEDKQLLKALLSVRFNNVFYCENLQYHLTFRPQNSFCKCLIECDTPMALLKTLRILKNPSAHNKKFKQSPIKHYILGNGSNTISPELYDGYIVKLGSAFKKIKKLKSNKNCVRLEVGAGVNLFVLNQYLKEKEIGGLEWSFGIPASVGGATIMNAGAFDKEFGSFIESVKILKNGKYVWQNNFSFSYRNSSFKKDNSIVVSVILKLYKSKKGVIENLQTEYLNRRKNTQPYNFASAGSVFKRMQKDGKIIYPAKIIDNLGLKGATIGQAEVSLMHAGFIINRGSATGEDYLALVKKIENEVREKLNLTLEREVEILK